MYSEYIIDNLMQKFNLEEVYSVDGTHVFKNNYIYVQYIEPHKGTSFRHMIRADYIISFDRWSVARFEEFFNNEKEYIEIKDKLYHMMSVNNTEVKMDMLSDFLEDGNVYEVECPNGCYSVICDGGRNNDKKTIKFCPYCGADLHDRAYPLYEED